MKYIAHRANVSGQNKYSENNPSQILNSINLGFDVEIDVWKINCDFFLGHDMPQYRVDMGFLKTTGLWCHAKNNLALESLLLVPGINCFWHENDKYTITSHGFIWVYPGMPLVQGSIAVMPESVNYSISDLSICYGVCTDNPSLYRNLLSNT